MSVADCIDKGRGIVHATRAGARHVRGCAEAGPGMRVDRVGRAGLAGQGRHRGV